MSENDGSSILLVTGSSLCVFLIKCLITFDFSYIRSEIKTQDIPNVVAVNIKSWVEHRKEDVEGLFNQPSPPKTNPKNPTPERLNKTSEANGNNPNPIEPSPYPPIPEKKRDTKDTIKNNVVEQLKREIKKEDVKLKNQADSLVSPVERSQFIEQGRKTIKEKARKQAVSLTIEENKKYRNILIGTEVSTVAANAASIALKDSGILENKDNNVSERVTIIAVLNYL